MDALPPSFGAYLHGLSIVAVPIVIFGVGAYEHPIFTIMMMPIAAIALIVHAGATVAALRGLRRGRVSDGARTTSLLTAIAAPVAAVWAWFGLETFPPIWWAAATVLGLAHLAWFLEARPSAPLQSL